MKKGPPSVPVPPPPPASNKPPVAAKRKEPPRPTQPSSLPHGEPEQDRAAVMAEIRRAPRLRPVDRSLVQDRSDAALYLGQWKEL